MRGTRSIAGRDGKEGVSTGTVAIHPSAVVHPDAVLGEGVSIGPHSIVERDVRIGPGTEIGGNVFVGQFTEVGSRCKVYHGAIVGSPPQHREYKGERSYARIGDGVVIREYATINRAAVPEATTVVGDDCLLMAFIHVAHDCVLGRGVVLSNLATLAGHIEVGDFAVIGGLCAVHQWLKIGEMVMVGGTSGVTAHVPPYVTVMGAPPAKIIKVNRRGLENQKMPAEQVAQVEECYRILRRTNSTTKAVEEMEAQVAPSAARSRIVQFLKDNSPIAHFQRT